MLEQTILPFRPNYHFLEPLLLPFIEINEIILSVISVITARQRQRKEQQSDRQIHQRILGDLGKCENCFLLLKNASDLN